MKKIKKILYNLIIPLVEDKTNLYIKNFDNINENQIILIVYAKTKDIGRLIGKQGVLANSIRNLMYVASFILLKKQILIKFESY